MNALLCGPEQHPPLSDDELLRRWLNDELHSDRGETFFAIYNRFRDMIRGEMERAGLDLLSAESRIGSVFVCAEYTRETMPPETSLRDRLLRTAREIATDPNWKTP